MFKGIPYATAPVGPLRWRPPQRLALWEGVRSALELGPAPVQELPPRSALMYRLNNDDAHALVMSEDCLYLNVWSPEPGFDTRLPVLVWIHGGAYRTGHGGQDLFDGARMAARGLVVVTVNMRLGALGFLSLPELAAEDELGASGNYGLLDVVSALGWVQEHIAAFGGDPGRVTLAGNSAGAETVTHLMAAPRARGLFTAAIGQSVAGIFRLERGLASQHEASTRGQAAVASIGDTLQVLRDQPATAFLRVPPQGVVVDGRLIIEDTTRVYLEGRQARMPLLAGWNADEGSLYASPKAVDDLKLAPHSASSAIALQRFYPGTSSPEGRAARRALVGDRRFAYPVWRWARTHAETQGAPVWLYEFEHRLPLPADLAPPADGSPDYGTFHTAELPYTWDNLAARPWAWTEADRAVARRLADAWARFVIAGDPNGAGLPNWPTLIPGAPEPLMKLGASPQAEFVRRREAFCLFDDMHFHVIQ